MKPGNQPFFIVGVHRSGTTLLRYMLSSHPRIYVPPESDFIPRFFQKQPLEPMPPGRARGILKEIFQSYRFSKEWVGEPPEPQGFIESLPDLKPATFLDALYREYASHYDAQRWGDKTPIYASYMDLINTIFPRSKFIHIIRDARDVTLSMLETWGENELHIDPYFAAASWVKRTRQALRSARKLAPDQYYQLTYEELVSGPEAVLREVCMFLGEDYYPSMATPHLLGRQRIPPDTFHTNIRQPIYTAGIRRWIDRLAVRDLKLVQRVAGSALVELGYEIVDTDPMNAIEAIRFNFLKVKYHLFQAGRSVLQRIGVYHPN